MQSVSALNFWLFLPLTVLLKPVGQLADKVGKSDPVSN